METDIMTWLALEAKQVFYLDGKLFHMITHEPKADPKRGVRGRANFADLDIVRNELVLWAYNKPQVTHKLNTIIEAQGDVAILNGLDDSRGYATNRLHRTAPPRTFGLSQLEMYLQTRTRMGVVDYRIVEDNVGIPSPVPGVDWKSKPDVNIISNGFGKGKDAVVFSFVNDITTDKSDTIIIPRDSSEFTIAGRNISFTSRERSSEGETFV